MWSVVGKMNSKFDEKLKAPATISTQHPDNSTTPEWSSEEVINGTAEVYEAFYSYSTLGCQEVMWDSEGKDTDTRVVRKLLQKHWDYFSAHTIGEDVYLTYRIPNPKIEGAEKKFFMETLQNIPVAYDVASLVYKRPVTPIFEVILPFTTDAQELIMLLNYYKKAIIADEELTLYESTKTKDWIGSFHPKTIKVIPLVEDFDSILHVDNIMLPYLKAVKPARQRVFLARSDPALNYGLICAVLLTKIALSKLRKIEKQEETFIDPILGVGSKPFRGHLSPENVDNFLEEYKGLSTVTVQSAFRYDYPLAQVKEGVECLNQRLPNGEPETVTPAEEETLMGVLSKCRKEYESQIELMAPFINSVSAYVPPRRARKLHIGLFGYSRNVAGISLPRAISFAASLYSVGLPPEFIGLRALNQLNDKETQLLKKYYVKMEADLKLIGEYVSMENINMLLEMRNQLAKRANMSEQTIKQAMQNSLEDLKTVEEKIGVKLGPKNVCGRKHENFTNNFLLCYLQKEDTEAKKALLESAKLRKCLG
jgi:phosphoenolpyruvate carboxylase